MTRVSKPVEEFELPTASRWERSRVYQTGSRWAERLLFERNLKTLGNTFALEHFDPDFVNYEPSAWLPMRWAIRQVRPGPGDVLVDFGAGKGRVVCEAARYPFSRVLGVEVAHTLTEAAQQNVDLNRSRFKCQNIELVTADAAEWEIPADMTVAYLYHPFAGDTFQRVINNIIGSIERTPRRLRLIYVCPVLEQHITDTGYFRPVARRCGRGNRGRVVNTVVVMEHAVGQQQLRGSRVGG
jgi:hypothetical protein